MYIRIIAMIVTSSFLSACGDEFWEGAGEGLASYNAKQSTYRAQPTYQPYSTPTPTYRNSQVPEVYIPPICDFGDTDCVLPHDPTRTSPPSRGVAK